MSILLLQKKADNSSQLADLLRSNKWKPILTLSIEDACEHLDTNRNIDLVLMQGFSLKEYKNNITTIRKNKRSRKIPIIIFNASIKLEDIKILKEAGVDDIIVDNSDEKVIIERISTAIKLRRQQIMLVDDEPLILDLLKEVLHLEGFKTITAESAEDALGLLDKETVHCIVSDIQMTGMSGLDLLEKIKSSDKRLPVILITGFTGKYTPEKALQAGADGYIKKPFHNLDLVKTVDNIVTKYSQIHRNRLEPRGQSK